MKVIVAVLLAGVSLSSSAAIKQSELRDLHRTIVSQELPACVTPRNYYDQVYCSSKVYSVLDDVLNAKYAEARKVLSPDQNRKLKTVQLAWMRERDDHCAKLENGSVIVNLSCATEATVESIYYLEQITKYPDDFPVLITEYGQKK